MHLKKLIGHCYKLWIPVLILSAVIFFVSTKSDAEPVSSCNEVILGGETDWNFFSSEDEARRCFRRIAIELVNAKDMRAWLENNGFKVFEYYGREAGFPENESAVRLLAGFTSPFDHEPVPETMVGQLYDFFIRPIFRPFRKWSFRKSYAGITVLYSDPETFLSVKLNP